LKLSFAAAGVLLPSVNSARVTRVCGMVVNKRSYTSYRRIEGFRQADASPGESETNLRQEHPGGFGLEFHRKYEWICY